MKIATLATTLLLSILACISWAEESEDVQPPVISGDLITNIPDDLKHLLMENPHVRFLLLISENGELLYRLATESNHYELIEPATRLIDQATFTPAFQEGQPVPSRFEVTIRFRDVDQERWKETGVIPMGNNTMKVAEKRMYDRDPSQYTYQRSEIKELDTPLQLISGSIVVLKDENGTPVTGDATVEYYIDHNGHALLPTIQKNSNNDPLLTMSVIKTLEKLLFEPPAHDGKPTYVIVKQTFSFTGE